MNEIEEKAKKAIEKGYFQCTRTKSDVGVMRCVELQKDKFCSCPLGEAIRGGDEAIRKRFDFAFDKKKRRKPRNAKIIELDPGKIIFLPSDKPRSLPEDIIVYDTPLGYYSYDARVNAKDGKITAALVPKGYEEAQKILREVRAMEYREIPVREIIPFRFQKRRNPAKDLDGLAQDVKEIGVIVPVVVRPIKLGDKKWEIICGERRWRAAARAGSKLIPARIVEADDLQARRMHLSENLQRKDLTPTERTEAIADFIDACLLDDKGVGKEYKGFGKDEVERVKNLLKKMHSIHVSRSQGYKPKEDKTYNKFIISLEKAFSSLSRPISWQSFFVNDLPLITQIDPEVKELSVEAKLSKSLTKELDKVKREAPQAYQEIKEKIKESPKEVTAEKMRSVREREAAKKEVPEHPLTRLEAGEFSLLKRELGEKWKDLGSSQVETILLSTGDKEAFKASLSSVKEKLEEKQDLEYELEMISQRELTFDAFKSARNKLEEALAEAKTGFSFFYENEDNVDKDGFIISLEKLLQDTIQIKKSIEEEAYLCLSKLSSNGGEEKVRECAWARKLLEERGEKLDPVLNKTH